MALEGKTTFVTNIATGVNGDRQGDRGHASIHNSIGSVLNNLQDDIGIDNSVDTASLKYKVANINNIKAKSIATPSTDGQYPRYNSSTDNITWETPSGAGDMTQAEYDPANIGEQLVGLTATQTLTNKRLTSPKLNEDVAITATATEINYSDGVTSAIQTQIDAKSPTASPTFTGTVTLPVGLTGVIRADSGVTSVDTDVTDLVSASSTILAGKVELAITSEINTGTDSTRAIPIDQYVASNRNVRYVDWRVLAHNVDQAVATTVGGDFEFPFTGTIISIGGYVDTAGTTNTATIDVHLNGTTIMTTDKISIETTEKSSRNATTQPTLTTTAITAGDILTCDIDSIQTTPAKGLIIRLGVRLT